MEPISSFIIKSSPERFDAIVVGSGITGGWAAKELTERGLKTLMVERGKPVEHGIGYVGENRDPWTMPNRGLIDAKVSEEQYPVQRQCYAFDEHTKQFFNNDRDMPYPTPARASRRLGLGAHASFSGALAWPYLYPWPQRPVGLVEEAFGELAKR